jgi:membrane-associated phospholipid phosphatase
VLADQRPAPDAVARYAREAVSLWPACIESRAGVSPPSSSRRVATPAGRDANVLSPKVGSRGPRGWTKAVAPAWLIGVACCVGAAGEARADSLATTPTPIDGLGSDVVHAFTGYNLFYYAGAVTGTAMMAWGGIDQAIRVGVQEHLVYSPWGNTSSYAGYIIPAAVAPSVYFVGLLFKERDLTGAGSASLQSLGIALLAMTFLKVAVGRVYPLDGGEPNAADRLDHPSYAHTFYPFQTAWPLPAWPSGHTLGTISVAASLTAYFPQQYWIPAIGYPLGILIGCGMVDGDRHWASDVIAGAVIGHAIGYSIGKDFRRRVHGGAAGESNLGLVPLIEPGFAGVAVGGLW